MTAGHDFALLIGWSAIPTQRPWNEAGTGDRFGGGPVLRRGEGSAGPPGTRDTGPLPDAVDAAAACGRRSNALDSFRACAVWYLPDERASPH
jgi:hypothetical protein